jgi:acetyl esterase/lipase
VLDVLVASTAPRPYPLVIFVHGGGWVRGDKRDVTPKVVPLLERGFAVASVNYRLSDQAHFPAPVQDVKAAVRYLRAHAAVQAAHRAGPALGRGRRRTEGHSCVAAR